MLSCQEFKEWLNTQGTADANTLRQMTGHLKACQTCGELHRTDEALDKLIRTGMQSVDPPDGLIRRARQRIEAEHQPRTYGFVRIAWKTAVPVLTLSVIMLLTWLNPFSTSLRSLGDVAGYSIANHLNSDDPTVFLTNNVAEVTHRLSQRLGHEIRLPDLKRLGLELLGGRKCHLGRIDAAYIYCNRKGRRASLFILPDSDVKFGFGKIRKYIVEEYDHTVTVWQESGMVYALVI